MTYDVKIAIRERITRALDDVLSEIGNEHGGQVVWSGEASNLSLVTLDLGEIVVAASVYVGIS